MPETYSVKIGRREFVFDEKSPPWSFIEIEPGHLLPMQAFRSGNLVMRVGDIRRIESDVEEFVQACDKRGQLPFYLLVNWDDEVATPWIAARVTDLWRLVEGLASADEQEQAEDMG